MTINGDKHPFTDENFSNSPDKPGVYQLYDGNTVIYIGKATVSIQSRLRSHKSGDEGSCTKGASHYKREVTSSPTARERELLQEYKDSYGKLPRCNDVMP